MSSRIDWYLTDQPKVAGLIPVGAKTMVAHFTYLQFVHQLAAHVRAADPQARITIREGVALPRATPTPVPLAQPVPEQTTTAPAPAGSAPEPSRPTTAVPAAVADFGPPLPPAAPPPPVRPQPDPGMVTSVPGMSRREPRATPPPPAELVPAGYASLAEKLFSEDEELFQTRLAQQEETARAWLLRFPDGIELELAVAMVLGRNPVPPDRTAATPVPVADPSLSVSKTHALIDLTNGLPWITDLHSTNGTTLTNEVGEAVVCEPGVPVPAGDGWTLGLGEFSLGIRRATD
jgi:FHA domain